MPTQILGHPPSVGWRGSRTDRRVAAESRARCEPPAGLEAALQVVLQPLDDALGLRIARLAEVPADPQRAAEGGEVDGRTAARGVQPGLAIPHQRLRQRAQRPQAARIPNSRSGVFLEKISAPAPAREYPGRRRRHSPFGSGHARPESPPGAPTDPTDRSPRAGRRCAERSAATRKAGAPRAGSHRRSSCRRRTPAPAISSRVRWPDSAGSSLSSRWISCLNGSNFDALARSTSTTERGSEAPRTPPPTPKKGVRIQPAEGARFSTGADLARADRRRAG
jgi:hypothetical protein